MVVVSLNLHILGQILYASPGFHWLLNSGRRLNAGLGKSLTKSKPGVLIFMTNDRISFIYISFSGTFLG